MKQRNRELVAGIDNHPGVNYVVVKDKNDPHYRLTAKIAGKPEETLRFLEGITDPIDAIIIESSSSTAAICDCLEDKGYNVKVTNNARLKPFRGKCASNDWMDAELLVVLWILGRLPLIHRYPKEMRSTRSRWRTFLDLKNRIRQNQNRAHSIVLQETGLNIPTSELFSQDLEAVKQYGLPVETLAELNDLRRLNTHMKDTAHRLQNKVHAVVGEIPAFALLSGIRGMGKELATTIILEVGDISNFASSNQLLSYAGLVRNRQTSNGRTKHTTNAGCNPRLRHAFRILSLEVCLHDKNAHDYSQILAARKDFRHPVLNAMACKMARAVFHMLKDHVEFDPALLFGQMQ